MVVDEQAAVPVGYDAACRILDFFEESVAVGVFLVVVAHDLEREQAYDVHHDDENGNAANHVFPVFKSVVLVHFAVRFALSGGVHLFLRFSITMMSTAVIAELPPMFLAHCPGLKKLNDSSVKNARWKTTTQMTV